MIFCRVIYVDNIEGKMGRRFRMKEGIKVEYPVIDVYATGKNIERLRKEKG